MKLKIWHNSNFGNKEFERPVPDLRTAKEWLRLLADYDLYLGERVQANAQGLMFFNETSKEWEEWVDVEGADISAVMDEEDQKEIESAKKTKSKSLAIPVEELSRRKQRQ